MITNIEPRLPLAGPWKDIPSPHPHLTVSGFAFDDTGRFPIIYRSDKVRSAKNCWSIPSGLHEVGLTMHEQFAAELKEELNLEADLSTSHKIGFYENIALVDSFHWCILLMAIKVKTLDTLTNKEPDRHPEIELVHYTDLLKNISGRTWAPNLGDALQEYWSKVAAHIKVNIRS
jgi:ADP-ribose pyrophosphatase YjhB (NUDIX family)